jgi:hypothetical protein
MLSKSQVKRIAVQTKNLKSTPKEEILEQMGEPRPLPMGRKEFHEWSDRIISGALIKGEPEQDPQILIDSVKGVLANMILHLGPTEDHKPDAYFIHAARKGAANQTAITIGTELRERAKERLTKQEAETLPRIGME